MVASTAQQEVKTQEATSVQAGRTMQELTTMLGMSSARSLSWYEDHSANRLERH